MLQRTGTGQRQTSRVNLKRVIPFLLLFIGLQYSLLLAHAQWPPKREAWWLLGGLLVLACIPPVNRRIAKVLDAVRQPARRTQWVIAAVICIVSAFALYFEARHQQRSFVPRFQDEYSYLVQARMLASGRLWMPAHELAEFFTSFQLLAEPVYGSIYFPGAGISFVPGVWLGLPFWVMPLVTSAIAVGLLYLVFTELIDGVAGILGATMLLALPMFRMTSVMALAQAPTIMLALATLLAWLRWRASMRPWRAMVFGACAGWLMITRPVDALCVIAPIAIAALFDLRRRERRLVATSIITVVVAAAPFLALQVAFNLRVTGSPLRTPFDYFADLCYPQTSFGFHGYNPSIRPKLDLPQVQKFYDVHSIPFLEQHANVTKALAAWRDVRLKTTLLELTPGPLLMMLAPVGLLGLVDRRRWVAFAILPMFVGLYFCYVFFLPHYVVIAAPAMLLTVAMAVHVFRERWPVATALVPLAVLRLTVLESSRFNRSAWDDVMDPGEIIAIDRTLATIPSNERAIVLFRFDPRSSNPHVEPVYNTDVAWPDDARIIRAHDRGDDRNVRLFEYYAKRAPDRIVYRYDRATGSMSRLGTVAERASRL